MGRINSWRFAINLANERFLTGGGFDAFQSEAFQRWARDPTNYHDSHSIWFQMLGMHGDAGLAIYQLLWWFTWRCANDIIRTCQTRPHLRSAGDLAAMILKLSPSGKQDSGTRVDDANSSMFGPYAGSAAGGYGNA